MNKTLEVFSEMHKMNNMALFLKRKLNADSKSPVEISSAIGCTRVVHSLQSAYSKVMNENPVLTNYAKLSRKRLIELNEILRKLNNRFTENDEASLSTAQKETIVSRVVEVHEAIQNISGKLYADLETQGKANELTPELHQFGKESLTTFIRIQQDEEEFEEKFNKAEEREVSIEDIEEEEDVESGFTLGESKDSKGKPRVVITPDIEI